MLQYLRHDKRCQEIYAVFSWAFAAWLYFYKKMITKPQQKMHPPNFQKVHCIKITVFSHIKTQRLIQKSLRFLFCLKFLNSVVFRTQRNDRGEVYRFFVQKNKHYPQLNDS